MRKSVIVIMFVKSIINPIMRIVQGNPKRGRHCCTMIGKITPPVHDPIAVNPRAKARLRTKYVDTSAMDGQNCNPFAMPKHKP